MLELRVASFEFYFGTLYANNNKNKISKQKTNTKQTTTKKQQNTQQNKTTTQLPPGYLSHFLHIKDKLAAANIK